MKSQAPRDFSSYIGEIRAALPIFLVIGLLILIALVVGVCVSSQAPVREIWLSDGTRCVYGMVSGGPGGVTALSCDWGRPR